MEKVKMITTGKQQEYLEIFLRRSSQGLIPEAAAEQREIFRKRIRPQAAGEEIFLYVTTDLELHQLNGLSCRIGGREEDRNLAVPNYLAKRLGLEPIGHELGLEVFGQGLHYTEIPQVYGGFVICTIKCGEGLAFWDEERKVILSDPYYADAIRLQQEKHGFVQLYPTGHVARSGSRNLMLYREPKK